MSDWTSPVDEVDEPTRRLGTYLAVGIAVHFFSHLLGIGVDGMRVELFDPFFFAAALFLAKGSVGARGVLIAWYVFVSALILLLVLFSGSPAFIFAALLFGAPLAGMHIVAVAYTVASVPPALGLPERWRPWATSQALHVVILLLALGSVFSPRVP